MARQNRPQAVIRIMFSPRERQVLELLAEARSIKSVASSLRMSTSSVYGHLKALCDDIGIPVDRGALIHWCCKHPDQVYRGVAERVVQGRKAA